MRTSGVLLPIFSLPGKYGIGCLSKEAYAFVRYLKKAGQTYWQILPASPTSYGDSPYQSFSTFAGNPYFISLEDLIDQGLLKKWECREADLGDVETDIDYAKLYENRYPLLRKAFKRSKIDKNKKFKQFVEANKWWLKDYCRFMAIKDMNDGKSFLEWEDEALRAHDEEALREFGKTHRKDVLFYAFLQFEFFRQWNRFKKYANKNGIQIIGDLPIYVSADSADAWANPELFQFDEDKRPIRVAGCPPDGFSATGQLWGNPLYDWEYHKKTGYEWWSRRFSACQTLYDVVRIDHFRGFDEYYSIDAAAETAVDGYWERGPSTAFFKAIEKKIGKMHIIAEDLGYQTKTAKQMVKDTGYPNMKVLQFAFDAREAKDNDEAAKPNDYLPFAYDHNCVCYTGTHDNETLYGFLQNADKAVKKQMRSYVGLSKTASDRRLVAELIRAAMASPADYCIIPLQDYLCLGNEARTNEPSTMGMNWRWRATKKQLFSRKVQKTMKKLIYTYYR